ncbi:MAG: hypothetical protein [Cressdnaviricota sp.]|nr:MAG: hypothetical protein [Cressdnaviricota sp.]
MLSEWAISVTAEPNGLARVVLRSVIVVAVILATAIVARTNDLLPFQASREDEPSTLRNESRANGLRITTERQLSYDHSLASLLTPSDPSVRLPRPILPKVNLSALKLDLIDTSTDR